MNKLILIDGNAILHRAFHALPPLTAKDGQPINAVYGFTSILFRIITDLEPTQIAVCFDRKEPTFRHKRFKKYQAQRPETHRDLLNQFEKVKRVIMALRIPAYEKAGYEADDLIATLANQTSQNKKLKIDEVVIVTGDQDLFQLVNNKIKIYLLTVGISRGKLVGEVEVIKKLGVHPSQIVDYKALVGDSSDNYQGVSGVGPKTATRLLSEYGSIDEVYHHLDKIPPRLSKKLKEGKTTAFMAYWLATVVRDVPLEIDFLKMGKWEVDNQKTRDLFVELGFKSLIKRMVQVKKSIQGEGQMSLLSAPKEE